MRTLKSVDEIFQMYGGQGSTDKYAYVCGLLRSQLSIIESDLRYIKANLSDKNRVEKYLDQLLESINPYFK